VLGLRVDASQEESATVDCSLDFQEIGPEASMKMNPVMERLLALSSAQLASQNPMIAIGLRLRV
jgi:hypothetical protein